MWASKYYIYLADLLSYLFNTHAQTHKHTHRKLDRMVLEAKGVGNTTFSFTLYDEGRVGAGGRI